MLPDNVIRDLQSRFGAFLDVKYGVQRYVRTRRKKPFEYEFEIIKYLNPDGRCAIDAGANQGQTIDAIRLYHEHTKIYSFEPGKQIFEKLKKKFISDKNLELYNLGLGKAEQSANLYVPYYRKFMYDGLSSFTEDRAANWLNADRVWRFNPKNLNVVRETCHISRLDKFKLAPFFLKIHVQGFEYDVLEGGTQTIQKHSPVLLLANHAGADAWLRRKGWRQFVFENGLLNELKVNLDSVYNCIYLHPDNTEHTQIIQSLT